MFNNLKQTIKTVALEAVELAETQYNSGEGQLKKQTAITYIEQKLTLPAWLGFLKPVILKLLSELIDDAVETAVTHLKHKLTLEEQA